MALIALSTAPSYAADSPLAVLLDLAAQAAGPDEDEQRDDAQTAAAPHLPGIRPHLRRRAGSAGLAGISGLDRRHRPPSEPSAVAWLDGGLWLHHTLHISEADGARDVLTLIVPCTCGGGYADILLATEDALIDILDELRPTHGHSPHTDTPVDCHSIPAGPALPRLIH